MKNCKNWISGFVLVLLMASLTSCKFHQVEFKKFESFKLLRTTSKEAVVELQVMVKNPNSFPITVSSVDLDVSLNQTNIGKVTLDEKVRIKARSEKLQRFVIKANYSDLAVGGFSSLLSMVLSKKVNLSCNGTVNARSMGISRNLPLSYTGEVPLGFLNN